MQNDKINEFKKYILGHITQIIVFLIIVIFDISILIWSHSYYLQPVMFFNYIKINAYESMIYRNEFVLLDNKYYFCGENGRIDKDKIIKYNGKEYYMDKLGVLVTDKENYEIKGQFYNIDKDGVLTRCK